MAAQEEANISVIKAVYEFADRGDRVGWLALVADDCEFHEPPSLPYGGSYVGKRAMEFGLTKMREAWEGLEYEVLDYLASGEVVVVHLQIGATGRKTGKHFWTPVMELWRVREGKIVELRPFIFDTARMVDVFG